MSEVRDANLTLTAQLTLLAAMWQMASVNASDDVRQTVEEPLQKPS
jgi:hypothetical protein